MRELNISVVISTLLCGCARQARDIGAVHIRGGGGKLLPSQARCPVAKSQTKTAQNVGKTNRKLKVGEVEQLHMVSKYQYGNKV